jgi:hypothetical protein
VKRSARNAAIAAFFALVLVGLLRGGDERDITATSFGRVPQGYGAVYDLLGELGFPVARVFDPIGRVPAERTVWWITPDGGCAAPSLTEPGFADWIRGGGTAVVFLSSGADCAPDAELAGLALPARLGCGCEADTAAPAENGEAAQGDAEPETGEDAAEPPSFADLEAALDGEPGAEGEPTRTKIEGPLVRTARELEARRPISFVPEEEWSPAAIAKDGAEPWQVVATRDGQPFALERRIGAGRLVVVADGRFLANRALGRADSALLATDLASALGAPWFDERAHGLVVSRDAVSYLLRSPAAASLAGLLLLALAFAWFGAAEPPRRVAELDLGAPTLESYVASLAGLYAATGDHARVLERYREVTARRLRRRLGLAPDAPLAALLDRLTRRRGVSRDGIEELRSTAGVRSGADLARHAAVLDRLVEEASR